MGWQYDSKIGNLRLTVKILIWDLQVEAFVLSQNFRGISSSYYSGTENLAPNYWFQLLCDGTQKLEHFLVLWGWATFIDFTIQIKLVCYPFEGLEARTFWASSRKKTASFKELKSCPFDWACVSKGKLLIQIGWMWQITNRLSELTDWLNRAIPW